MTEPSDSTEAGASGTPERSRLARHFNPHGYGTRGLVLQFALCLSLAIFTVDRLAHALFWPEPDATEVLLVGSPDCPFSRAAKAHLEARNVPFREVMSPRDPFQSALAAWAFQSVRVPIVVVGPEIVHGYREQKIDAALVDLGYEVAAASERPPR